MVLIFFIYPKNFITLQLTTSRYIEQLVSYATITLKILSDANQQGEVAGQGKISYQEFYNDCVNKEVDIRQDYTRWREAKQHKISSEYAEKWEHFSFVNFPFILG